MSVSTARAPKSKISRVVISLLLFFGVAGTAVFADAVPAGAASPVWDSALSYWGIQQNVPFTLPIDVTAASLPLTGMTVNTGPANTTGFGLTNVNLAAGTATMVGTYTAAPSGSQQTVKINAINASGTTTSTWKLDPYSCSFTATTGVSA